MASPIQLVIFPPLRYTLDTFAQLSRLRVQIPRNAVEVRIASQSSLAPRATVLFARSGSDWLPWGYGPEDRARGFEAERAPASGGSSESVTVSATLTRLCWSPRPTPATMRL